MSLVLTSVLGVGAIAFLLDRLAKTSKFQLLGDFTTRVATTDKVVALTYDDGPNPPITEQLIALLDRLQVKATFFVLGKNVEQAPETVQTLVAQGHELGNHSYSHRRLTWQRPQVVQTEIEKTDLLLRQFGVKQDIHFRAPFGFKLLILPWVLKQMGKQSILWSVDPKDYATSDAKAISDHVVQHVAPGSIILLHDGGSDRTATVMATETIVKTLQAQGYTFKTVSELMHHAPTQRPGHAG